MAFLALVIGSLLLSCGYTHYYFVSGYEAELSSGSIDIEMWLTQVRSGEDVGNAVIHGGGNLWSVNLTFWPACRKPTDVELIVDSVSMLVPSSGVNYPIERSRWRRYQSDISTTIEISPISLPRNSYPDLVIELLLRVKNRGDGSILDQRKYRLDCTHRQYM